MTDWIMKAASDSEWHHWPPVVLGLFATIQAFRAALLFRVSSLKQAKILGMNFVAEGIMSLTTFAFCIGSITSAILNWPDVLQSLMRTGMLGFAAYTTASVVAHYKKLLKSNP